MKVSLIAAMTVDGFIGRNAEERSFDWTSEEDKRFYVESIKRAKVVVMGLRTFRTFTRYPKGLKFILYTSTPEEFVNPRPEIIEAVATKEDPKALIEKLAAEGHEEVMICGGAQIYTMFLRAGVVDTLYLTIEPVAFGGGVKLFAEQMDLRLHLANTTKLSDQTLLLEYHIVK